MFSGKSPLGTWKSALRISRSLLSTPKSLCKESKTAVFPELFAPMTADRSLRFITVSLSPKHLKFLNLSLLILIKHTFFTLYHIIFIIEISIITLYTPYYFNKYGFFL
ncbi:hypothetical protein MCHI_003706 [Candidatus Magnetoovum chiemensis]|nr:hypothetical protein MCHI_003706 [Candidatus Magnetoovum chiemensis]